MFFSDLILLSFFHAFLTAPGDYTATSMDGMLQSNTDEMLCISVIIQDDANFESCETFMVSLSLTGGTDPNILLSRNEVSVIICDNESKSSMPIYTECLVSLLHLADVTVTLTMDSFTVGEEDEFIDICINSSVTGNFETPFTVFLTYTSAKASMCKNAIFYFCFHKWLHSTALFEDFIPPEALTVVGAQENTSCTHISIINDTELEGHHDFCVEISNISTSGSASIGAPSVATITILDDEG